MRKILTTLLILGFFLTPTVDAAEGTVEEQFIEQLFSVSYQDAKELREEIDEELTKTEDSSDSPTIISIDSSSLTNYANTAFGQLVDADYLQDLLINGTLLEIHNLSLKHQTNYEVDAIERLKETYNDTFTKLRLQFQLIEKEADTDQVVNSYKIDAILQKDKVSEKINFFKVLNKDYLE